MNALRAHLTNQQKHFCMLYIENGNNCYKAACDAKYSVKSAHTTACILMKKPAVITFIAKKLNEINDKLEVTFEYKIKKLVSVVDFSIPDDLSSKIASCDAEDISDDDITIHAAKIKAATLGVSTIAELNKMQGHYSAEKHISANLNVEVDAEIEQVAEIFERVKAKRHEY